MTLQKRVRKEYKVLSQKDKWWTGKFEPARLERVLNDFAEDGWRVVASATADIPKNMFGIGHDQRQEMILILERDIED
ncbi:MAG: DUF4177 domain-containing protein [Alphaproteobacteria bacterium]|nr:DUF4177 domain-containing protein [Alphaproteobacteria bacterium]